MTDMAAGRRLKADQASDRVDRATPAGMSDRLHADGDALARERGWTITTTTGRFGFGGRVYRDPDSTSCGGRRERR